MLIRLANAERARVKRNKSRDKISPTIGRKLMEKITSNPKFKFPRK
jgi:hypothetical protein